MTGAIGRPVVPCVDLVRVYEQGHVTTPCPNMLGPAIAIRMSECPNARRATLSIVVSAKFLPPSVRQEVKGSSELLLVNIL